MVETKTLFLAGMPGYVHLNRPCYLRNASKTLGSPAIVNPTEVLSAVFQEQEKPHHLSSSFPDPLRCCSCLGQVLELEMLVSSPQFLRKKKKKKKGLYSFRSNKNTHAFMGKNEGFLPLSHQYDGKEVLPGIGVGDTAQNILSLP